jgi:hypothetical protein
VSSSSFKIHKNGSKRHEDERVYGENPGGCVFIPLLQEAWEETFYRRLGDMLSYKRDLPYSIIMGWLRCKLSFALLRSCIPCIQGSRSSKHHAIRDTMDIALACSEGCVPQQQ